MGLLQPMTCETLGMQCISSIWEYRFQMINKVYCKIFIGPWVALDIFQPIHWVHFMQHSSIMLHYKHIQRSKKIWTHGDFSTLLQYLRTNIHQHGQIYSADQICNRVTGESLNPKYFMDYAKQKFGDVYGI